MTDPRGRARALDELHDHSAPAAIDPPFLFARQRVLLGLLANLGEKVAARDFQQLLFLYCESSSTHPYDFVPCKDVPHSFTAAADWRKLVERGLLADDEGHWKLTASGRKLARTSATDLVAFARRHQKLRGSELDATVSRLNSHFAPRSAKRTSRLQTIGYEGRTLESYLGALLGANVTLLCDVRRNPISRKYGFSKRTLAAACDAIGLRYEHLPALGIASDKRRRLESQDDYDSLFDEYERESLPKLAEPLATIAAWVGDGEHVALTCYEHLPGQCHRHCVASALESKYGKRFAPKHL